ncbi:metal ABC transporter permease [Rhodocaloribacter litoris]|uniref:metal ABC transporter permease n=1 Tax=Rhodocaloribacter litoris TaxID=2558931 RepID=UPI001420D2F3|nr:metal ABC transporter permease [Rhodocaloribacter litoris]QXD14443.1 metal ABC transporter permease [Rhodocaloribacter litoris]
MTPEQVEIQLVAVVVAAACALPGAFLVLRRMAMMSDAISHAILPGIVVAFFLTEDLNSPLLILGAALTGVLTVALVELIHRTRLVKEDAAIGLVFPVLFSLGVILIARFAGDVHLDTDAVLLGELAFAPFDRLVLAGYDLGPKALYVMGAVGLLNALFLLLFYKELKLATFDAGLAAALGFAPGLLHYGLMTLVSMTAVGAFDAVGSILVVALMIGPPATAYLLTDRLDVMIGLGVGLGAASAVGGYWLAHLLDASIAGAMATVVGLLFAAVFFLAPERGLLALVRRRRRQRWIFAVKMLTIHLLHHEGGPHEARECRIDHLQEHLRWEAAFADRVVREALGRGLVRRSDGRLHLTDAGRTLAREAIVQA